ncbi:DNA helicase [Tanacetum coccineum]|uniref:ATP-dependent DNA helicase n=1 Tax=Tanacetum coccineum TaxID=301880 RepID=A0ABQ5BFD2_9ASTR
MKIKSRPIKRKSADDLSMECVQKDISKKTRTIFPPSVQNTDDHPVDKSVGTSNGFSYEEKQMIYENRNCHKSQMSKDEAKTLFECSKRHGKKWYTDPIGTQYLAGESVSVSSRISPEYSHLGRCTCVCRHCGAMFWECEKIASASHTSEFGYNKCCYGGRVILRPPPTFTIGLDLCVRKKGNPQDGYQKDMKLVNIPGQLTKADKRMSMNMYYSYQIHDRLNHYNLLLHGGKLFQQYVVTAYCAIEQTRLDFIRQKQDDIRSEYLSGIYDAILRGDRDGSDLGLRTVLTASFTGSPRYMYAHYLDALAICRVHGSPSFFITFTCNTKWPEIEEFMKPYPQLTVADRADIIDRVFEKKVHDYIDFVRDSNTFGSVTGDIRKINNKIYPTNKAACQALGLLSSDQEWVTALEEASLFATAPELRKLFVYILIFCNISDPLQLWNKVWKNLSDDIPRKLSKSLRIPQIQRDEKKLKASILFELERMLNSYSKSLQDFALPMPPEDMLLILQNRLLMEETNYDQDALAAEKKILIPRLNKDQRLIFDEITHAARCNVQKLIFVYGHGGTGKTFLWKAVTSVLRSEDKIVLTVAASGIAALLLPQLADLLRQTHVIIWDEAPMNDRRCFEALDRSLKDICNKPNSFFGGKSIMLGGDFRQTLPVKKKASKPEILDASITSSYLWPKFKVYTLMENMRLHQPETTEAERIRIRNFSNWLLDVGNGTIGEPDETDIHNTFAIQIPTELCIPDSSTALASLIEFIYDQKTLQRPTTTDLQKKAIVCPKNEDADMINAEILALVNHEPHVYLSFDEAVPHGNDGGETELLYPPEYLNSLNFAGFPPHRLEIKVGSPIILLRNLNISGGLCNGTRLIVTQLLSKVIEARIITGTRISEKVFLPRIPLINRDLQLPFIFKRKQFPVKLCYAMTINKSQGQSLERIGIFLPQPVFAHGQLYVALSRATSPGGLKILIKQSPDDTKNMTKNIVYKDFLSTVAITQVLLNFTPILMTETNDPNMILKDKGKLPLVETNSVSIADIKLTLLNQTIEARVYRKWLAKNVVTQVASNFCVILLDKQGNAIQANMDVKDTDYFSDLLQLNDAYRISRFRCIPTKTWDRTLPNDITLTFGKYTSIIPISIADFPEHYFNFIAYNEVNQRATQNEAPLTSILSKCIYRISDPLRSGDATRTRRVRRIIDVQNLDGMNLPFLIWGDKAENFDMDEYNQMQKPVIIAIASAWATKKYGGLQLSSTSATHYYLNPNIPEATYIFDTPHVHLSISFGIKPNQATQTFKWIVVLQPVAEPLLALPAAESIKSPATQVLDEASISNNPTTTNKDQPEAGKLPAQTSAEILEDQAKKTRRSLFQETDTTTKKPRRNA